MLDALALGRAQQAPGGDAVDLLDRGVRLVALGGGEVHDGLDAAQRVAEGRRVAEVAERDLHADPLRAQPAGVADEAAHRRPAVDEAPQQRGPDPPVAPVSREHAPGA